MGTLMICVSAAILCTLAMLTGCGGGDNTSPVNPFPKEVAFESLDGTPNQIFIGAAPARNTPGIDTSVGPLHYAVALYKVFQTDAEAAPVKALFSDPTRYIPAPGSLPILLLTQSNYFTTKSLVTFDLINLDYQYTKFRVTRLVEQSDQIEVTLEACSTRTGLTESQVTAPMGYFAIAKTSKPVVILPLQFSPIPSNINDVIGKCPVS